MVRCASCEPQSVSEHAVGGAHDSGDAERYLRRFVDQSTRLTDPSNDITKKFLEHLYEETGISSRMNHSDFTRPMFEAMVRPGHSSLRDLEQSVHRVAFVLASIPLLMAPTASGGREELTAVTLMVLREVNWGQYRSFVSGYGDAFHAGQGLINVPPNSRPPNVETDVRLRMELMLLDEWAGATDGYPFWTDNFWNRYIGQGREGDMEATAGTLRPVHRASLGGTSRRLSYLAGSHRP